MRKWAGRSALALILAFSVGCGRTASTANSNTSGAAPSVAASPSSTASPSDAASPSPTGSPSDTASPSPTAVFPFPVAAGVKCPDLVALGLSRALLNAFDPTGRMILCDARDPAHPRLLQALGAWSAGPTFLGHDLIGYVAQKGSGPSSTSNQIMSVVSTLNLTSGHVTELATSQGSSWAAGWSPDGSSVAYFTDSGGVHHYWLKRGSAAPVGFSTAVQVLGRGGISDDESLVAFSYDSKYVLVVDTAVSRLQAFRTSDAALVYAAPSGGAGGLRTMAVWAHNADRFYFRNNNGVYRWDASSGISSFIGGLRWYTPSLTSDDRFVAYAVVISYTPHVEMRDLSSGAVTTFATWRDWPIFVGETTLLVHEEAKCDACMGAYNWTGKTFVIHTDTRGETDLGITGSNLVAFWPHG